MAKATRSARVKAKQSIKPEVPSSEVEDYAHPVGGGHHETMGYDPYCGDWDRAQFGNEKFLPDPWEGPMPVIKRPDDGDHDYDNDHLPSDVKEDD